MPCCFGPQNVKYVKHWKTMNKQQQQSFHPRATPFSSRQRAHIRYSFLPHFVGGNDVVKSLLFSPYPAIPPYVVKTPHPGMTDDRSNKGLMKFKAVTWRCLFCSFLFFYSRRALLNSTVSKKHWIDRDRDRETSVTVQEWLWRRWTVGYVLTTEQRGHRHFDANMIHLGRPFNFASRRSLWC